MQANHRAVVVSLGVVAGLGIAWFLAGRPEMPRGGPPPSRDVEFAPLAARLDSAGGVMVLKDAPEPAARPATQRQSARGRPPVIAEAEETKESPPVIEVPAAADPQIQAEMAVAPAHETTVVADARDAVLYVPGCVGYAKRMWAAGEAGAPAQTGVRRNCNSNAPREINLDPLPAGICANPERDRGLPAMCAQARRRR